MRISWMGAAMATVYEFDGKRASYRTIMGIPMLR
jgi:hypothetical protein